MRRDIAEKIAALMVEMGAKLNQSTADVQSAATTEEFRAYRSVVARIMGEMLTEIMNPIYREHPDLKPPGLE